MRPRVLGGKGLLGTGGKARVKLMIKQPLVKGGKEGGGETLVNLVFSLPGGHILRRED